MSPGWPASTSTTSSQPSGGVPPRCGVSVRPERLVGAVRRVRDADQDDGQALGAEGVGEPRGALHDVGRAVRGGGHAHEPLLEVDDDECGGGVECGDGHGYGPFRIRGRDGRGGLRLAADAAQRAWSARLTMTRNSARRPRRASQARSCGPARWWRAVLEEGGVRGGGEQRAEVGEGAQEPGGRHAGRIGLGVQGVLVGESVQPLRDPEGHADQDEQPAGAVGVEEQQGGTADELEGDGADAASLPRTWGWRPVSTQ